MAAVFEHGGHWYTEADPQTRFLTEQDARAAWLSLRDGVPVVFDPASRRYRIEALCCAAGGVQLPTVLLIGAFLLLAFLVVRELDKA